MDPKVPNKLASIFVTGGLATVLISFFYGSGFIGGLYGMGEIATPDLTPAFYSVVNSARFLVVVTGVITFIGAIMQGIGHIIRYALQLALPYRSVCRLFFNGFAWDEIREWDRLYVDLSRETLALASQSSGNVNQLPAPDKELISERVGSESSSPKRPGQLAFAKIYEVENEAVPLSKSEARFSKTVHPIVPRQSVSIFFRYADGQHLSWVLQHYATYYLTTDILASLLVTGSVVPLIRGESIFTPAAFIDAGLADGTSIWIWIAALIAVFYLLIVVSIHRYLYTYIAVVRHCCAAMSYPNPNFPNFAGNSTQPGVPTRNSSGASALAVQ